jgi:hypothetical protein
MQIVTIKQHINSEYVFPIVYLSVWCVSHSCRLLRHGLSEPQLNTDYHAPDACTINQGSLNSKATIPLKRSEKFARKDFDDYNYISDTEEYYDEGFMFF